MILFSWFLFLARTGLEDLGNSQQHLPIQERSARALGEPGGRPGRAELALGDC